MTNDADHVAARELALYAVNTGRLYRERATPIITNLRRKKAKGTYDAVLAVKAWRHLADAAAKEYAREFGPVRFNPATRDIAAVEIADHYEETVNEK